MNEHKAEGMQRATALAESVRIGRREVGPGQPCYIVAEAGSNHNQSLEMAKELIDVAAEAGCDAVKFQTFSAATLYSKKTPQFSYLGDVDVYKLIEANELPRAWQAELFAHAQRQAITFLCSPFDLQAVDELAEIGVLAYKIASFELVDHAFLRYIAAKGKPLLLSTGMANLGDIEEAVAAILATGNREVALLHCNSVYPTPMASVNLRAMETMRQAFRCAVGFSDHTVGTTIPVAAAALGANVIEKHFTLSRRLPGPDHGPFALEPDELKALVQQIRWTATALGNGIKTCAPDELEFARKGRRSIVAAMDIPAGAVLTAEMLVVKRPGLGIPPKFMELLIGRRVRVDIAADEPVTWAHIG